MTLHWFTNTLRRHFNCGTQYHHLETFLATAPPEVVEELAILMHKIEELAHTAEANKRVTSRTIRHALMGRR